MHLLFYPVGRKSNMIETKYQHWLNFEGLDADLKKELEGMNEFEKNDAFYTNVEFGTAGMRGVLGAGTNRLNIYTINFYQKKR